MSTYTINEDKVRKSPYWTLENDHTYHYLDLVQHTTPDGSTWTIRVEGQWAEGAEPRLVFTSDGLREYADEGPDHLVSGWSVVDGVRVPSRYYAPLHGDFGAYVAHLDAVHPAKGERATEADTSVETMILRADPVAARRAQIEYDAWLHEHDNMD